jgi:hypothetical protein
MGRKKGRRALALNKEKTGPSPKVEQKFKTTATEQNDITIPRILESTSPPWQENDTNSNAPRTMTEESCLALTPPQYLPSPSPSCLHNGCPCMAPPESREVFAKNWGRKFLGPRKLNDDRCFVKRRQKLFLDDLNSDTETPGTEADNGVDMDGDSLGTFLNDFDDSMALVQVDEVQDFCHGVKLKDVIAGVSPAGFRRNAWVDDREFSDTDRGGNVRKHKNPVTATSLYRILEEPVR